MLYLHVLCAINCELGYTYTCMNNYFLRVSTNPNIFMKSVPTTQNRLDFATTLTYNVSLINPLGKNQHVQLQNMFNTYNTPVQWSWGPLPLGPRGHRGPVVAGPPYRLRPISPHRCTTPVTCTDGVDYTTPVTLWSLVIVATWTPVVTGPLWSLGPLSDRGQTREYSQWGD